MYTLIPQLLIVFSIAGIVVILLRKIPGVQEGFRQAANKIKTGRMNTRTTLDYAQRAGGYLSAVFTSAAKRLWQFVLDVKGLSKTAKLGDRLPKKLPNLPIKNVKLPFFKKPSGIEVMLVEAGRHSEEGNYKEAEQIYIDVIKQDGSNEAAFAGLGRLYLEQGKKQEALETYKFLVKHRADNALYQTGLGRAYYLNKLFDQAIESYEKAIEIDPSMGDNYIHLGQTLDSRKRFEEAILNYKKAIELSPDNTEYLLVLSDALKNKGETSEAGAILEKILQMEPTNHVAREKLMQMKFPG